jgi:hypothetical protein
MDNLIRVAVDMKKCWLSVYADEGKKHQSAIQTSWVLVPRETTANVER